jgi:tRNA (cmo5U34)-methyltransferase
MKSTPDEIRQRFDKDVTRFSNEETGQCSTADSLIALSLIENCIVKTNPDAANLCDIGCGAGNFSLRIIKRNPNIKCTLIDLSESMLIKAQERIRSINGKVEKIIQGDIREIALDHNHFDVVVAAAVLHHLRSIDEWTSVLKNIYDSLVPGGTFWIWDLIMFDNKSIQEVQSERYKEYLTQVKNAQYQADVFSCIEKEDTPESTEFILKQMFEIGFEEADIVHKNILFSLIYGKK